MTRFPQLASVVADDRDRFAEARPDARGRVDLSVRIGDLVLTNPVMPASGCFGPELGRLIPTTEIGATVTKTVFAEARGGNEAPRLSEVPSGMVNSVGIPSRGPAGYLAQLHAQYESFEVPTIISVGGHRPGEYAPIVAALAAVGDAYELNVSCPNLDNHGMDIGASPDAIIEVVASVREVTSKPLIVKLPPMVTSIVDCARAAEVAGADAICIANSIPVLAVNKVTRRPLLGNIVGGLSGPHIRPIILRLVWLASQSVSIPIIGCGGISGAGDALEYLSVGAAAVQVGTANFGRPFAMVEIVRELQRRCLDAEVTTLAELLEGTRL